MSVAVSMKSRSMVYHEKGCMYIDRIAYKNQIWMDLGCAERKGYHECSCCSGLAGFWRTRQGLIRHYKCDEGIEISYDKVTDTLYIRTDVGFWKIFRRDGVYILHHLNHYDPAFPTENLIHKGYHRQKDVKPSESVLPLLKYIKKHDEAKKIIAIDYRLLPNKTKAEKKYYQHAKNRAIRQQHRRIDDLFRLIEEQRLAKAE